MSETDSQATQARRAQTLPEIGELQKALRDQTIAVVGNGSNLLKARNGDLIENHDVVVRMNRGLPPPGLFPNLGSRTDLWSFSGMINIAALVDYHGRFGARWNLWLTEYWGYAHPVVRRGVFVAPPESYRELRSKLQTSPSTGCLTLDFLIRTTKFKSMTVLGFDFFATGNFNRSVTVQTRAAEREKDYLLSLIEGNRDRVTRIT